MKTISEQFLLQKNNILIENTDKEDKTLENLIDQIKKEGLNIKKSIINNGVIEEIVSKNIDPKDFERLFIETLINMQYLVIKV